MVRRKLNNQGFTFVELVITVAILSIITVSIATFMATTSRVYSKTSYNNEVQSQALEVYDQISNCIMQANKVILYGNLSDGSGGYEADERFFVSDKRDDVAGYETANGAILDSNNSYVFCVFGGKNESGANDPHAQVPRAYRFLKKDDGSGGQEIKEVLVKALYVEYQTKVGSNYETCYATFYVSDDGDLYLNRHYSSDADIANYTPATASIEAVLDKTVTDAGVLCNTLKDEGFSVMVDAENNSIGLVLNFDNCSMTYDTLGMVKIRNEEVLTR